MAVSTASERSTSSSASRLALGTARLITSSPTRRRISQRFLSASQLTAAAFTLTMARSLQARSSSSARIIWRSFRMCKLRPTTAQASNEVLCECGHRFGRSCTDISLPSTYPRARDRGWCNAAIFRAYQTAILWELRILQCFYPLSGGGWRNASLNFAANPRARDVGSLLSPVRVKINVPALCGRSK